MCHGCRRARARKDCAVCGVSFIPKVGAVAQKQRQVACSLACGKAYRFRDAGPPETAVERERERLRAKNRRRRAAMRGANSEPYTLAEIATRDRSRCGLCRRPVSLVVPWPDLQSPVIDHVIPLSRGGSDLRANVQLAHFGCNASKGAAGGGEQLALIG